MTREGASTQHFAIPVIVTALANMAAVLTFDPLSVAMTEIARSLGLNQTQELWLPDAFLIAVVCATPLSAYLMGRFGIKRLLTVCLAGTVLTSSLAGFNSSVTLLLVLLFAQGLMIAPLAPTTQALIASTFPQQRRNVGMAIWSGATMFGILLGSYLGGYVSSNFGWPWIFAICIPPSLIALILVQGLDTSRLPASEAGGGARRTDGFGMALLVVCLLASTVAMNLIAEMSREQVTLIAGLSAVALIAAVMFFVNYRRVDVPILDFGTLRDRPLAIAATLNLMVAMFTTGLFEAEMLGTAMGFDAEALGTMATMRGVAMLAGTGVAALILARFSATAGIIVAMLVLNAGKAGTLLWVPGDGFLAAVWPGIVSSVGYGMVSTALAVAAFSTIARRQHPAAAAVFGFGAVLGSAMGVASLDALRALAEGWLVTDGAPAAAASLSSYYIIFWVQLVATMIVVPLPLLSGRSTAAEPELN